MDIGFLKGAYVLLFQKNTLLSRKGKKRNRERHGTHALDFFFFFGDNNKAPKQHQHANKTLLAHGRHRFHSAAMEMSNVGQAARRMIGITDDPRVVSACAGRHKNAKSAR